MNDYQENYQMENQEYEQGYTQEEMDVINQELVEMVAERRQKKAETIQKQQIDEDWKNQVKSFSEKYPGVNLKDLEDDKNFIKFITKRRGTISSLYEDWLDFNGESDKEDDLDVQKNSKQDSKKTDTSIYGLSESQKKLAKENGMSYKEYAKLMKETSITAGGVTFSRDKNPAAPSKLTDRQKELCRKFGMDEKEYLRKFAEI